MKRREVPTVAPPFVTSVDGILVQADPGPGEQDARMSRLFWAKRSAVEAPKAEADFVPSELFGFV